MPIESPRGRAARSEPNVTGRPPRPAERRPGTELGNSHDENRPMASPSAFPDDRTAAGPLPSWVDGDLETPPSAEAVGPGEALDGARNPFEDDVDTDAHPRREEAARRTPAVAAATTRVPFRALSVEPPTDASADLLTGETVANVPVPLQFSSESEGRVRERDQWQTRRGPAEDAKLAAVRSDHSPAALFDGEHATEALNDAAVRSYAPVRAPATKGTRPAPATRGGDERATGGSAQAADAGAAQEHSDDVIESGPPRLTRWRMGPSRALRASPRAMPLGGGAPGISTNPHSSPPLVTDVDPGGEPSSETQSAVTLAAPETTVHDEDVAKSPWPRELGVELNRATTMLRSLSQFGAYLDEQPREEFARRVLAVHQCLQSAAGLLPRTTDEHDDDGEVDV